VSAAGRARYAPARAFPPYAYVPGRDPHPTQDPRGHSHGVERERARYVFAERWRDNAEYLFGVDLYNAGFLWEAHEAWEAAWQVSKHDSPQAELLQGLIQCAAACLKIAMGQPRGVEKLAELGLARLERVARDAAPTYMGLDVADFARDFRAFVAAAPASPDARPRIVLA
jgi:predicted metal-dependent hydrolase